MKEQQNMVREFHEKCGAVISDKVKEPSACTQELRMSLVFEEYTELCEAFGWHSIEGIPYSKEKPLNMELVADALGDLLYVVLGAAVSCGIDMESVFAEIHRSNMTKFIDGHLREDGKWVKGPSYTPPNLAPLLL